VGNTPSHDQIQDQGTLDALDRASFHALYFAAFLKDIEQHFDFQRGTMTIDTSATFGAGGNPVGHQRPFGRYHPVLCADFKRDDAGDSQRLVFARICQRDITLCRCSVGRVDVRAALCS
jgi:hypothetical protein